MKISFDYDHCLTQKRIQESALTLVNKGYEVWIITSRFDNLKILEYPDLKPNEDVFETAKKLRIPTHRIGFTNQEPKWISLNKGKFSIHIDDNKRELESLKYYNVLKGIDCNAENFEEQLAETIREIENF